MPILQRSKLIVNSKDHFPGIRKGKDCFGVLERKRVRLFATLTDFLTLDPLQWVTLHKTDVLCLYARQDRILRMYDEGAGTDYKNDVSRICPRTRFRSLEGDHFFSQQITRDRVTMYIKAFLQWWGSAVDCFALKRHMNRRSSFAGCCRSKLVYWVSTAFSKCRAPDSTRDDQSLSLC